MFRIRGHQLSVSKVHVTVSDSRLVSMVFKYLTPCNTQTLYKYVFLDVFVKSGPAVDPTQFIPLSQKYIDR